MKPINRSVARIAAASALVAAGTLAITNQAGAGGNSEQFSFSGEAVEFVVPADVCSITVDAYGASGTEAEIDAEARVTPAGNGTAEPGLPGLGGRATADIDVTPGETLHVVVGGMGEPDGFGGFNGGGDGGDSFGEGPHGGGGGGATDVRRAPYGLADRLVVAGGGGGGGAETDGENDGDGGDGGGESGVDGLASDSGTPGGGGGTQTAGGAAPTGFDPTAQNGELGDGGNGGAGLSENDGGGGGGGGYYGGAGGAGDDDESDDGGGGGGGSGFGPAGVTFETGVQNGDGMVELTWTVEPGCADQPSTTTTTTTAAPAAAAAAVAPRFTG